MIRTTLLWLFISLIAIYAWKDWFKSLCGLILLMAVYKHPDMPSAIFNIPGLNPWNLLLGMILIAWTLNRQNEGLKWDMPGGFMTLLVLFLCMILISVIRMIADMEGIKVFYETADMAEQVPSITGTWNDYVFNCAKWAIPGMLLFDGCRNRSRVRFALVAIIGIYFLLAIQTIRWVPLYTLQDSEHFAERTISVLRKEVGYHRTDLSVMLAGAAWALLAAKEIIFTKSRNILGWTSFFIISLGQALTAGRGGYLAWAAIGLILCTLKFRKLLLLVPLLIICIYSFAPGLVSRMDEGMTSEEGTVDQYTLTAGRSVAWPMVIEKIYEAPFAGYGREAMKRTGIATTIFIEHHDSAPHPHNAYLEMLLDNGLFGFTVVVLLFSLIIKNSLSLFQAKDNDIYQAVGGTCLAIVGAHLVGSLTGQTFYPNEASVGLWCSIGLLLRMVVDRRTSGGGTFSSLPAAQ